MSGSLRCVAPWLLGGMLLLGGCSSADTALIELADADPLPYSVMISGGCFLQRSDGSDQTELARTFQADDGQEVISLRRLRQTLAAGRVFVSTNVDGSDDEVRRRLAALNRSVPLTEGQLVDLLLRAEREGHDFLLVVEMLKDGPVLDRGINGRWPITLATWLFALGWLIPDRTYQSSAALHVSLRDVHSGDVVFPVVVTPGEVELSQFGRSNFWGFLQSVIIPPFWTSVREARIRRRVQATTERQLAVALAQELKSPTVRSRLQRHGPADIRVERAAGGLQVSIDASDALSYVRLRADLRVVEGEPFERFQKQLLASQRRINGRYQYRATYGASLRGRTLQVLVRTVAAGVGSVSFALPR